MLPFKSGPDEGILLAICVYWNTRVFNANAMNPTLTKLMQRQIFSQASSGFVDLSQFPFSIHPVMWEALQEKREWLLENAGLSGISEERICEIWRRLSG
jgi:hypothetical protein